MQSATEASAAPAEPAAQAPEAPAEEPLAEVAEEPIQAEVASPVMEVPTQQSTISQTAIVKEVLMRSGIQSASDDQIKKAIFVYIIEQRTGMPFIHELSNLLKSVNFKPIRGLHFYDQLDEVSKALYNALHQIEEEKLNLPEPNAGAFSLNESQKSVIFRKLNKIK